MLRLMWSNKSSMLAQQQKLDSISNNLANVNTTGYKKTNVSFEDLVYETLERNGVPISEDRKGKGTLQNGTGVRASSAIRDNKQGNLIQTNVNTDLALDGKGFFQVTIPDGSKAYVRAGSFNVDIAGNIVDSNGDKLTVTNKEGQEIDLSKEEIKLTNDNFSVQDNGMILVRNGENYKEIGKIKVSDFVGDNSLLSIGENLYVPTEGSNPIEAKDFSIMQGFLEQSNVDVGEEMTEMIMTQRAFQLSSSSLKTADEMWGMVNNLRR